MSNSLTERVSTSESIDLYRSFPRRNTAPLIMNDKDKFLIVEDDFVKLLRIITLLETIYKEALRHIASKRIAIEKVAESRSDFLLRAGARYFFYEQCFREFPIEHIAELSWEFALMVEAGYYLCGQIFRGFPINYIASLSWQKKMAHESGLKAPFEPPGHGRRCSQAESGRVVIKTDCASTTPSEVSGPSTVNLESIDESYPALSKNPGDMNWSSNGPITRNILYQIDIRQIFQGFVTSAAAFVKYAAKAANSIEWVQSAWTRLVMCLEPELQPGMTRIRWKCVSMSLVPERAFGGSNANALLHSALWESPLR